MLKVSASWGNSNVLPSYSVVTCIVTYRCGVSAFITLFLSWASSAEGRTISIIAGGGGSIFASVAGAAPPRELDAYRLRLNFG